MTRGRSEDFGAFAGTLIEREQEGEVGWLLWGAGTVLESNTEPTTNVWPSCQGLPRSKANGFGRCTFWPITLKFLRDLVKQDDISTLKHEQMPVIAGAVHFGVYQCGPIRL